MAAAATCTVCVAIHPGWTEEDWWPVHGNDGSAPHAVWNQGQYWTMTCPMCRLLIDLRYWAKFHPDRVVTVAHHLGNWIKRYMPNRFDPERGFKVPRSFPGDQAAWIPMEDSQILERIKQEEAQRCPACKGTKGMIGKGFRRESATHKTFHQGDHPWD